MQVINQTPSFRGVAILAAIFVFSAIQVAFVSAEPLVPSTRQAKSLRTAAISETSRTYDFNLGSTFDKILSETASTDLYDSFTVMTLKRMQAEAQPAWDPAGIDPDLTRQVAERAFSIQAGRTIVATLKKSDLRETYRDVISCFTTIQEALRLTLKDTGSSWSMSKKAPGKKLIEFKVEFNMRHGLDPQLNMGETMRFRYDTASRGPLLEYGFAF